MFYLLTDNKMYDGIRIGYSDYGDIWLKIMGDKMELKMVNPLDYEYMEEYIDNNSDLLSEWQDDAYHGNTELGYDEWRENYEYQYGDYFNYDSELDIYYDENDSDYTWDYFYPTEYSKEEILEKVLDVFEDTYNGGHFEWVITNTEFRNKIGEYYDECIKYKEEQEEKKKPHWNVFNYYK